MKKIYFTGITFIALLLTLFIWSCNKEDEIIEPKNNFTEITIPDNLKANLKSFNNKVEIVEDDITFLTQTGQEIYGKIRVTFPYNDATKVLKIELSSNIMQELNLQPDFFERYYNNSLKSTNDNFGECFTECEKADKGVFWCKLGCFAIAIVDAAVPG